MAKLTHKQLKKMLVKLTTQFSPDVIQIELGKLYEEYSVAGTSEAEVDMWLKCSRASLNLGSGMNKWMHEALEDLQEGEE